MDDWEIACVVGGYGVLYEQKGSAREREKRELSQHTAADAAARR